jgi:hypothetical protein
MSKTLALIGFAEALSAPEAAWSLTDAGFEVIAYARRGKHSAARHSRLLTISEITAPEQNFEAAVSDLSRIMREIDAQHGDAQRLLLPLDDASVLLTNAVYRTDSAWQLAGPRESYAELALNKFRQIELARRAGFEVPESWPVTGGFRPPAFPIILKAGASSFLKDGKLRKNPMWICSDAAELEQALAKWDGQTPLLAQRFVRGVGEGVFGIATPEGVRAWSAHRRLRMMNPHGSGSSACISQPVDASAREKVEAFLSLSGWQGLFMVELLRDRTGKIWFVELNGRPWGSTALSRRQRLEYPAWQARLALGEAPAGEARPDPVSGIVCRNLGREFMHLLFLIRGPQSRALQGWPSFWKSMREIVRFSRKDRFYNWRPSDPMVFFADCFYTVMDHVMKARS